MRRPRRKRGRAAAARPSATAQRRLGGAVNSRLAEFRVRTQERLLRLEVFAELGRPDRMAETVEEQRHSVEELRRDMAAVVAAAAVERESEGVLDDLDARGGLEGAGVVPALPRGLRPRAWSARPRGRVPMLVAASAAALALGTIPGQAPSVNATSQAPPTSPAAGPSGDDGADVGSGGVQPGGALATGPVPDAARARPDRPSPDRDGRSAGGLADTASSTGPLPPGDPGGRLDEVPSDGAPPTVPDRVDLAGTLSPPLSAWLLRADDLAGDAPADALEDGAEAPDADDPTVATTPTPTTGPAPADEPTDGDTTSSAPDEAPDTGLDGTDDDLAGTEPTAVDADGDETDGPDDGTAQTGDHPFLHRGDSDGPRRP